jgi:hypothetical protein
MISKLSLGLAGMLVLGTFSCSGKGNEAQLFGASNQRLAASVGKPCTPDAESWPTYQGLTTSETLVDDGAAARETCGAGVCLAYDFQGRVTCPVGYDPSVLDAGTCKTPEGFPVSVSVLPQLPLHAATDHVICSCRCDGPANDGPYCSCPVGFKCKSNLVANAGLGSGYAGGYCVKAATP